jgi:hypothetical protein
MLLFLESGPKKNFRVNSFTKTVTSHLRSIGPNVRKHMAYFAIIMISIKKWSNDHHDICQKIDSTCRALAPLALLGVCVCVRVCVRTVAPNSVPQAPGLVTICRTNTHL